MNTVYTYIYIYVCLYIYKYIYTNTNINIHVFIYICIYIYTYIDVYICVYINIYMCSVVLCCACMLCCACCACCVCCGCCSCCACSACCVCSLWCACQAERAWPLSAAHSINVVFIEAALVLDCFARPSCLAAPRMDIGKHRNTSLNKCPEKSPLKSDGRQKFQLTWDARTKIIGRHKKNPTMAHHV